MQREVDTLGHHFSLLISKPFLISTCFLELSIALSNVGKSISSQMSASFNRIASILLDSMPAFFFIHSTIQALIQNIENGLATLAFPEAQGLVSMWHDFPAFPYC